MKTIKETLIDIRDNRLSDKRPQICFTFRNGEEKAFKFLHDNKPCETNFKEFTESDLWDGVKSWWVISKDPATRQRLLNERKRFLTKLIETL